MKKSANTNTTHLDRKTIYVPQPSDVVCARCRRLSTSRTTKTQLIVLTRLCFIQELLVSLQALGCRASNDGSNSAPLRGHQLGQMQQFLILLPRPLDLTDTGIQPFNPSCLALLWCFPCQQRGNTRPLIETVFRDLLPIHSTSAFFFFSSTATATKFNAGLTAARRTSSSMFVLSHDNRVS